MTHFNFLSEHFSSISSCKLQKRKLASVGFKIKVLLVYRNIFIFASSVEKDTDKAPVIFFADFWSMNYFITIEKKLC